jgi:hypothetical protein
MPNSNSYQEENTQTQVSYSVLKKLLNIHYVPFSYIQYCSFKIIPISTFFILYFTF